MKECSQNLSDLRKVRVDKTKEGYDLEYLLEVL